MTYQEIVNKVSGDTGISPGTIDKTYKAYWIYIRDVIQNLPLKDNLSEEDFNKLRTTVNIPSLGKIGCTYERYNKIKDRFKYIRMLKDKIQNNEKSN